jgi:hypothetical protein
MTDERSSVSAASDHAGRHHAMRTVSANAANSQTSPTPTITTTNPSKVKIKTDIEKPVDGRSPADQPTEHSKAP